MTGKTGRWADSTPLAFACIAVCGLLIYGHTLHVPWYSDDIPNIVENGAIRDLGRASRQLLFSGRGLAQWTFALNYHFAGLEVSGYHLINIAIHLATATTVLLILRRLFAPGSWLPLLGTLLFLVHPLQTQAITYIVQRMTSLSGLCFFLSLALYIRAREALAAGSQPFGRRHLLFYLASLLSGAAAVLIKQNAAILPLALLLFDVYFLPQTGDQAGKRRLLYLLPFCLMPFGLTMTQLLLPLLHGVDLARLSDTQLLASQQQSTPFTYLVTELSVIWLYIRLLVLPFGQVLDYSYPLATHILTAKNLLALCGLAGLLGGAIACRRKLPLVSFGLAWFLLTLSVESSLIPLDPVYEHRLYVPLFGFVLIVLGLLQALAQPRQAVLLLLLLIPILALLAWKRNALWNDPVAFYQENLQRVPGSERVRVALAKELMTAKRYDEAQVLLEEALRINPGYDYAYANLGLILIDKGAYDQALATLKKGLQVNPNRAELYDFTGFLYYKLGQPETAIQYLRRATEIGPLYPNAYLNLGTVYTTTGQLANALACYEKAIALAHENIMAHFNLGVVYLRQNRLREAQQEFRLVTVKSPDDAEALFNLAMISLDLGDRKEAQSALPGLQGLNPELANRLRMRLSLPRQGTSHD